MNNLKAELSYFRQKIGADYGAELSENRPLPAGAIKSTVEQSPFARTLSSDDLIEIVRNLEASFSVQQRRGVAVSKDFVPWLRSHRAELKFFYWERLKSYYLGNDTLPPQVVSMLDSVTDEVLDFCGNPINSDPWRRRGMVMGHVQSGKTTNYSALICKAADAGYKIIILLAGITNSLRAQTQERLDETFIGKKSVFQKTIAEPLAIVQYAPEKRFPAYGTSRDRDFRKDAASTYGVSLSALKEPIIFVTKKNKSTLELLRNWLKEQNQGETIADPLLLIDDEADNASINTSKDPKKVTAINGVIREILSLFERSSYVGYTATPFANIFIDPETEESMLGDDLFPRHFIKALDPPSNYVGANRVFDEMGDLHKKMVRVVDDYSNLLPLNHKRSDLPSKLPDSLHTAIRVFVITKAIRILRGDQKQHSSMMINVSRFNDVQERIHGLVYDYLQILISAIVANAGLKELSTKDSTIKALESDYLREFDNNELVFLDLLPVLPAAVKSISAVTVNMRGGSLDYSRHKADGLHVIAIGGLALSRGLTLEGLTVSYILRNTAASDTLMQMARWFGYRPNYEDICRIYLPKTSYDHYLNINVAIEELRSEIKRMQQIGAPPEQFGLRVRQSPTAIRITAANKMRSATSMTVAQDYSGRHIEGHVLFNDKVVNDRNRDAVGNFIDSLGKPFTETIFASDTADDVNLPTFGWRKISGREVLNLIRNFEFPAQHGDLAVISGEASLFADYVSDRLSADLEYWDVAFAVPKAKATNHPGLFGYPVQLRERTSGSVENNVFRTYGGRNRIADPLDARLFLSKNELAEAELSDGRGDTKFCLVRKWPLLLVHLFRTDGKLGEHSKRPLQKLEIEDPVVSLSFCMPSSSVKPVSRAYQVNAVYRKQLEELASDGDDDEAYIESGQDA